MKGTRGKTQRLPRFLREYRGEVPGCPGGVGAYVSDDAVVSFYQQQYWVTLSFADTKVSNFSIRPFGLKPNHFNFRLSKCKQNKYVMNDVVA